MRRPQQVDWLAGNKRFDWRALNDGVHLLEMPQPTPLETPLSESAPYALGLIACSAAKLAHAAPAERLYQGQLFRLALQVVTKLCQRVRILSAKHGVVRLDAVLEPYDMALPAQERSWRERWGSSVAKALSPWTAKRVLCLAPASYWREVPGCGRWDRPLRGLGIGQQKAALKRLAEE